MARNSIFVMTNTAATGLFGFVYWGIAAHGYNTRAVGVATALIAALNLMSLIGTLGIGQTLLQRLPKADRGEWSRLINCTVFIGAGAGLIVGALGVAILPMLSSQFSLAWEPDVAVLIVLGTAVLTVTKLLDYVFIAHRAAHHVLSRSLLLSVGKLALLIALPIFFSSHGVVAIAASWVAGAALSSVVTVTILVPGLGRPHRWTPFGIIGEMRRLGRYLILNYIISLSAVLIPTVMPLLVVARVSAAENAYFYMAWIIANLLLTVSAAVAGTLLAEGAYDPDALSAKVRQGAILIGVLLIGPALVITLAGRPLLGLFGTEYSTHAYVPLLLFLVVVVPDAVTNIYITVLRVRGRHHVGAVVNLVMSIVTLALAWVLLPRIGVTAAGWSWAVGQFVGVGIMIMMTSGPLKPAIT